MSDGVKDQEIAQPEVKAQPVDQVSDKELNFRRLEQAREAEKEARIRAEMQNEMLRQEVEHIKQMFQPKEEDPLDGVEDYVDPARLRAKLEKERAAMKRESKAIAEQIYEERKKKDESENFMQRLKMQYPDYDSVMNEANLAALEKTDPVFLESVLDVKDDYTRRRHTYNKLKSMQQAASKAQAPSIKEKVEENLKNPYYIAPSQGTPNAVEFDTSSQAARDKAYAALKAAQRRPIMPSGMQRQ
jgi:hypothetical protein